MHAKVTTSQWVLWGLTIAAQIAVQLRPLRQYLKIYLRVQIFGAFLGMVCALFASSLVYFKAYVLASSLTDALTVYVFFCLADEYRARARRHWQPAWLPIAAAVATLLATMYLSHLPLPQLQSSPWMFAYTSGHLVWTWLAGMLGLIPLYCVLTGSAPDRRLLLYTCGLGVYILLQSGTIDYLITARASHSIFATMLIAYAYMATLLLWSLAHPFSIRAASIPPCTDGDIACEPSLLRSSSPRRLPAPIRSSVVVEAEEEVDAPFLPRQAVDLRD